MVWSGTSDRGNCGFPNVKLPKKLKWTPLDICSSGLKSDTGASPPRKPARHAHPPRRSMARESRIVLLPTRSRTASICFRSAMRSDRSGPSISTRRAPSASNFWKRSWLRAVAMTCAPAFTAMFRAACPNDDIAPRITKVWALGEFQIAEQARPGRGVRFRDRGEILPGKVVLDLRNICRGWACVLGVAAVDRPPQAAHQCGYLGSNREFAAGAGFDKADTLDAATSA